MSDLSKRVAARFIAQEQEEASFLFPDPEKARKQLAPLFQAVQDAAKARDAETIGEYMAQIGEIYRKHPELQGEGRVLQASKTPSR